MKTAKELLTAYLQNINNADEAIALFSDDAAIELPYLSSLGLPWRWNGKDTLYKFLQNLPKTFPGFQFQNIQIHIDTPEQAFGEYEVECTVAATGRSGDATGGLGSHDRRFRLRRLGDPGLAHDDLPAILRCRRHLFRLRDGADAQHSPSEVLRPGEFHHATPP